MQIRYINCTTVELLTLSHWLDGDDFTAVSTARGSDSHHPDAVLTVPAQVGDAIEKHIRSRFKFTAHLREKDFISTLESKASLQGVIIDFSPLQSTAKHSLYAETKRLGVLVQTFIYTIVHASPDFLNKRFEGTQR